MLGKHVLPILSAMEDAKDDNLPFGHVERNRDTAFKSNRS